MSKGPDEILDEVTQRTRLQNFCDHLPFFGMGLRSRRQIGRAERLIRENPLSLALRQYILNESDPAYDMKFISYHDTAGLVAGLLGGPIIGTGLAVLYHYACN